MKQNVQGYAVEKIQMRLLLTLICVICGKPCQRAIPLQLQNVRLQE